MPKVYSKRSEDQILNNKISQCKRYNKPIDDIARFWSYVDIQELFDCWEWQGGCNSDGYGNFRFNGKTRQSHRLSYQFYHGAIPKGKQINHKCNNRKCCNPFHLYAGTKQDNSDDMFRAGRQNKAHGESHGMVKLTEKQVLEIRENKDNLSQAKLGQIYGVRQTNISLIIHNKIWKRINNKRTCYHCQ